MATIPLSDGTTLTVPDDVSDADAQRYYEEAEAAIKAEADNGVDPVPVDSGGGGIGAKVSNWFDSWTPEGEKFPFATAAREAAAGTVSTVAGIPNWPTNIANNAQELYDLHFGSGEGKAAYQVPKLTGDIIPFDPQAEFDKFVPPTPGWENFRDKAGMGITAAALTRNPLAALAVPGAVGGAEYVGRQIDEYRGDENHTWERTLPALAPFASRGVGWGLRKVSPGFAASIPQTAGAYEAAGGTYLATGAAKYGLKAADAVGIKPPSTGQILARGVLPYAVDNGRERW